MNLPEGMTTLYFEGKPINGIENISDIKWRSDDNTCIVRNNGNASLTVKLKVDGKNIEGLASLIEGFKQTKTYKNLMKYRKMKLLRKPKKVRR
jgi:hypothetical protein